MTATALTAFCLLLPEMNRFRFRSLRPVAGRRTRVSVPSMMPVFPLATAGVTVERSTPNQQISALVP